MFDMNKKSVKTRWINDEYALPKSSEKGIPFVDFNEVLRDIIPRKVKIRRNKDERRQKDM